MVKSSISKKLKTLARKGKNLLRLQFTNTNSLWNRIASSVGYFCYLLTYYFPYYWELPITAPDRIGHLLFETDCFLKELALKRLRHKKYAIITRPRQRFANFEFLRLISDYNCINETHANSLIVRIVPYSSLGFIHREVIRLRNLYGSTLRARFWQYATAIHQTATGYEINAAWGERAPIFRQPEKYFKTRLDFFAEIGLNSAKPYVLIHVREPGYSPNDEHLHSYRNADIDSYSLVIKRLCELGVNIIRIGDKSMTPLIKHENVFDYALSHHKSPEIDLVLASGALFFLGTASGAYAMSSIFGVPAALTNLCLPINFSPLGPPYQIGIPKLVMRKSTGDVIPFKDVFDSGISEWRTPEEFADSDFCLIDNTPDEICDLAIEMMARVRGQWVDSAEDVERQNTFRSYLKPGSYTYGTAALCGRSFMRKYDHLM